MSLYSSCIVAILRWLEGEGQKLNNRLESLMCLHLGEIQPTKYKTRKARYF